MYDPLRAKAKVLFYIATAFIFGLGIASSMGWTGPVYAMPNIDRTPRVELPAVESAGNLSEAFVNISRTVTPGVVRIMVRRPADPSQNQTISLRNFFRGGDPDDRDEHANPAPDEDPGPRPQIEPVPPRDQVGGGSGFLVSNDGYILTNNHVVEGASEIKVFLSDRRAFTAQLVGRDPFTDVAVIKIEGDDFQPMSFGDSDQVDVGEWIVAIGNPGFGAGTMLDYSVTTGIVSAIGRPLSLLNRELFRDSATRENSGFAIENFIQTDAVINPGNSGGPMVNLRGQVVGINSAIATQTGYYQGYGFAIPIDLAVRVMEDLIEFGHVRRPYLGVRLGVIDDVSAEFYGLPSVSGVEIEGVTDGQPAARAGFETGDVIWEVDGEPVATQGQLQSNIARRHPGDRVTITVYRDRSPMDIEMTLGEISLQDGPDQPPRVSSQLRDYPTLGLMLEPLDRETAETFGLGEIGVGVMGVEPDSPVGRRNFGPGVLAEINGVPIRTVRQAKQIIADARAGEVISIRLLGMSATGQPQGRTDHVRIPR
jgi:serine protease Do